ncbi:MAG: hypothetical protein J0M08_07770 [Bacteroidetes bacterium]|nr:hypothetical protein [Bacteroidota bacterium]
MKKHFLFALSFLVITTVFGQKKKGKPALDGKNFVAQTSEIKEGKAPKPVEDKVRFKNGIVDSDFIYEKTKFDPIDYKVLTDSTGTDENEEEIKIYDFEALGTNEKGEELKWEGTITGGALEAKVVWSKKGKIKKEFTITGESKDKKKK